MKKISSFLLLVIIAFGLSGCAHQGQFNFDVQRFAIGAVDVMSDYNDAHMQAVGIATGIRIPQSVSTVYVKPYTRKNGTSVSGHIRSKADKTKVNNFGRGSYGYQPPSKRDLDRDGIPNMKDDDDDGDGIHDDLE